MTKFDFISVLVSIVFGVGLTHLCGGAFQLAMALDVVQTALLGTLFQPWYYLPFIAQYAACGIVIHRAPSRRVRRAVAWWMFLSVLVWSLAVRRHLGQ